MEFGLGTYGISFAAGGLSTLSPCVLPIVPVLLASATQQHRYGPLALAAGLTLSFTVIGVGLASFGGALGLDGSEFRLVAAILLMAFGAVMLSTHLQQWFAAATSGLNAAGNGLLSRVRGQGIHGQFFLGSLLGLVWAPCVGPTLGATITLASQGTHLPEVTLVMLLFGLGASAPLVVLGMLSRTLLLQTRTRLLTMGLYGKYIMGVTMLLLGALIATGLDKQIETWALNALPDWFTSISTRL